MGSNELVMNKDFFDYATSICTILILFITAYFMYKSLWSPVDAVIVGRKLNQEQQKDNAKRNLFLSLFSLRGNPTHYDFVRGLNEIDVVFEKSQSVLDSWHTHHRDLHDKGLSDPLTIWDVGRIRLLSAMAVELGYGKLNQTDILLHYTPEGHGNREKFDYDLQFSALKFFEVGKIVYDEMLANTPSYVERMNKEYKKKKKEKKAQQS